MKTCIDQTERKIDLADFPRRIVSLVPSQTELLFDLGLSDEVAGITKFCIHPAEWFRNKTRVGGTKQLNLELIRSLRPDLLIANKEENEKSQIESLAAEFPVWISDVKTLTDAKQMILAIGEITGRYFNAVEIIKNIDSAFDALHAFTGGRKPVRVAYLIWNQPMMTAGSDTFIHSMLSSCGLMNTFGHLQRYPEINAGQLEAAHPDIILLSSEPFPFRQQHADEFNRKFPGSKTICADGELFSWYGSRIQHAPAYFRKLLEQIDSLK